MKVFLLFLFLSFILGANLQQATHQRRRWLMGIIALCVVAAYFLFDQLI